MDEAGMEGKWQHILDDSSMGVGMAPSQKTFVKALFIE
jgi:hypothetical protein